MNFGCKKDPPPLEKSSGFLYLHVSSKAPLVLVALASLDVLKS